MTGLRGCDATERFRDIPTGHSIGQPDIRNQDIDCVRFAKRRDCACAGGRLKHRPPLPPKVADNVFTQKPIVLDDKHGAAVEGICHETHPGPIGRKLVLTKRLPARSVPIFFVQNRNV